VLFPRIVEIDIGTVIRAWQYNLSVFNHNTGNVVLREIVDGMWAGLLFDVGSFFVSSPTKAGGTTRFVPLSDRSRPGPPFEAKR